MDKKSVILYPLSGLVAHFESLKEGSSSGEVLIGLLGGFLN